jgi:hypothetical protein
MYYKSWIYHKSRMSTNSQKKKITMLALSGGRLIFKFPSDFLKGHNTGLYHHYVNLDL